MNRGWSIQTKKKQEERRSNNKKVEIVNALELVPMFKKLQSLIMDTWHLYPHSFIELMLLKNEYECYVW